MVLDNIINYINNRYDVDIRSKKRTNELHFLRCVYYNAARNVSRGDYTFEKIGEKVNRDHATVMHGIKIYKDQLHHLQEFKILTYYISILLKDEFIPESNKVAELNKQYYNEIISLKDKVIELENKISEINENTIDDSDLNTTVLRALNSMSDSEVSEFIETRLNPFQKICKSRVYQKEIVEVSGAIIR